MEPPLMFGALLGPAISMLTGGLMDRVEGAWKAYLNKEITRDQLAAETQKALLATFADVEKAYADSLTKTFASFMDAAKQSRTLQAVWAAVALSQLCVLLWHQVGISTLCYFVGNKACWPSSGSTVDWAYALLALCLGGGAIALKMGPGSGSLAESLKGLVKR